MTQAQDAAVLAQRAVPCVPRPKGAVNFCGNPCPLSSPISLASPFSATWNRAAWASTIPLGGRLGTGVGTYRRAVGLREWITGWQDAWFLARDGPNAACPWPLPAFAAQAPMSA